MSSYRPSATNALRNAFWVFFDNLGMAVSLNLLFILTSLPIVTIPASFAGLMHATRLLIDNKEISLKDYFRGIAKYGIRFTLLYLLLVIFFAIGAFDILFYLRKPSFITMILNGWAVIFVILALMASIYLPALLINKTCKEALKASLLMALTNIPFSMTVMVLIVFIKMILILTAVPAFLFMFTFLAFFLNFIRMEAEGRYNGQRPSYAKDRNFAKEFLWLR